MNPFDRSLSLAGYHVIVDPKYYVIVDYAAFILALIGQTAWRGGELKISEELRLLAAQVEEGAPFKEAYAEAVDKFGAATMLELTSRTRDEDDRPISAFVQTAAELHKRLDHVA
tara:strand:- start:429 stop:770 length:342 start_codon:yes stop_codon:yes gene_type:complete